MSLKVRDIFQIKIESLNYSASAVGKIDGFVVFVPYAIPGDDLLVRITQVKRNYAIAEIVEIITPSEYRCHPPCTHFSEGCGGCQWQHITYEHQVEWKKDVIIQALQRIGKMENIPDIETYIGNERLHYRNKLRVFPSSNKKLLGLRKYNTHVVVPIKECLISDHKINTLSHIFQGELFSQDSNLSEFGIRVSSKGQIILSCIYNRYGYSFKSEINNLSHISDVASIFSCTRLNKLSLEYGISNISNNICGINYRVGPDSFFQVNPYGLQNLINIVKSWIGNDNKLILDAHCGVGTFALQTASYCDMVWGTDVSLSAIELARINAADNGIKNTRFRKGTMVNVLNNELRDEKLGVMILDPPREGCEKADMQALIRANPQKIVYVSCNPTTLARDLRELKVAGYNLLRLVMVDMFPMTYHLETVALCNR